MAKIDISKLVQIFFIVIGVFLGKLAFDHLSGRNPLPSSPIERAMLAELEAQGLQRELEAYIRANNATDPKTAISELSRRGIARLTTEELAERTRILMNLDLRAPVELCAARFMGTIQPAQLESYFAGIDSGTASIWARLSANAIKAELRATDRLPPVSGEETQGMFQTIHNNLSERDQERFAQVLDNIERASAADQCWMSTSMQSTALILVDPERSQLFKTMARIEAGL
jgi:hypothetical protein